MNRKSLRYVLVLAGSMALGAGVVAQVAAPAADAPAAQPQVDPSKVVITVGDQKVTAGEFQAFISVLPPEVQAAANGPKKREVAEELVRMKVLSNEARARKLDQTPRYQQQLSIMGDNILVGMLLQDIQNSLISEDDIKKFYDEKKAEFERVTARHILISTMSEKKLADDEQAAKDAAAKAKAEEIRKKLAEKPESFAELAKAESEDPGSKEEGGDLQPFVRGMMVKEFEEAAFTLKPEEISQPIKTPFGYHIIQVKKREVPALDEVKEQIADHLRQQRFETMLAELKKKADPKLDETFFPPAAKEEPKPAPAQQ